MILSYKTDFVRPIMDGTKIHTLREDKANRWIVGREIQFWKGNPRNVKQFPWEFFPFLRQSWKGTYPPTCLGIQYARLWLVLAGDGLHIQVSDHENEPGFAVDNDIFAKNDGFESSNALRDFFYEDIMTKNAGLIGNYPITRKIVHWTDFRYAPKPQNQQ